jgi:hypothetical protein
MQIQMTTIGERFFPNSGRALIKDVTNPNQVTFEFYLPSKNIANGYPQGSYIIESTLAVSESSKNVLLVPSFTESQ